MSEHGAERKLRDLYTRQGKATGASRQSSEHEGYRYAPSSSPSNECFDSEDEDDMGERFEWIEAGDGGT